VSAPPAEHKEQQSERPAEAICSAFNDMMEAPHILWHTALARELLHTAFVSFIYFAKVQAI